MIETSIPFCRRSQDAMETERHAVVRQNKQHTASHCRKQRHQSSPSLPSNSPFSTFSLLVLLVLLALLQVSSCTLPSRCYQSPPDPSSCSGPFRPGFYYNATSRRCYSWPNWGCPGNQLFNSLLECNNTCNCKYYDRKSAFCIHFDLW